MENKFITFEDKEYVLKRDTYLTTNQIKLQLMEFNGIEGGFEPFMTITKEVEHVPLVENEEVIIKNYSENEGILPVLIKAGIIAKPHETVDSGFDKLNICQLIE